MYNNEENMVVMPNHEQNGDYYENPSLPHLMDELWLLGKWQSEKLFLSSQSTDVMYPNEEKMILVSNPKKNRD